MRVRGAFERMIGKRIKGVVVKESGDLPRVQVFLLFADDTYFEFYGNSITGCNDIDHGGLEAIKKYMAAPQRKITLEKVDETIREAPSC
jgi:hypothetical protein